MMHLQKQFTHLRTSHMFKVIVCIEWDRSSTSKKAYFLILRIHLPSFQSALMGQQRKSEEGGGERGFVSRDAEFL